MVAFLATADAQMWRKRSVTAVQWRQATLNAVLLQRLIRPWRLSMSLRLRPHNKFAGVP